jgi:hypothetical protein
MYEEQTKWEPITVTAITANCQVMSSKVQHQCPVSMDHFSDQWSTCSHLILPTDLQSETNNYSAPSHTTMNTCNWDCKTLCKALESQNFPICTIHLPGTSLWKNLHLWINIFCKKLSQVKTIFSTHQWLLIWYRANSYITYVARIKIQGCPRQNAEWHLHESEKLSLNNPW